VCVCVCVLLTKICSRASLAESAQHIEEYMRNWKQESKKTYKVIRKSNFSLVSRKMSEEIGLLGLCKISKVRKSKYFE